MAESKTCSGCFDIEMILKNYDIGGYKIFTLILILIKTKITKFSSSANHGGRHFLKKCLRVTVQFLIQTLK